MENNGRSRFLTLLWGALGIGTLLLLWYLAARTVASEIILPAPGATLKKLVVLLGTEKFLLALGSSFLRFFFSIALSVPLSLAVGIAAGLDKRVFYFIKPFFSLISATPVLSVILILFLWLGQDRTPIGAAFLMIFPVMASNTIEGIRSADPQLVELFTMYGVPKKLILRHIYIPTLVPFILAGLRSVFSLSWKVIVAAEVLTQPIPSLGGGMQNAKAQLETTELFAWTIATVIFAALTEGLIALPLWVQKKRGFHR
jgi:NitT/TauT family transport system permease protein